jgi:galactose mutarotase-like enzyme
MAKIEASVAGIENVLIQAGDCAVTVLPQFGGKIASIQIGERELLQAPLAPIAPRTQTMAFDEGDASGWDECLPSVAACAVRTDAGVAAIPDHGDLWRVEWKEQGIGNRERGIESKNQRLGAREQANAAVSLIGSCFSLPLELERRLDLRETKNGWLLRLAYKLRNTSSNTIPWSWAAHPLFAVEEGDRIVLPESITLLRLEGSGGGRLGKGGDSVAWPMARLADGDTVDLRIAESLDSGIGDKLFAGPLSAKDNWCALERPSAGLRIRVAFDVEATPYLGLWICYGGWPERPGPKQMWVAMEPSTAPVDSLATNGAWSRVLKPGDCFSWPMDVEIERIER